MNDTPKKPARTLGEDDITTKRHLGRRAFLGIMAAGSVGAVLTPTQAAAADVDNGTWTDSGSCPRGGGGAYTNLTDSDNGNITDAAGYGRGAPYC
ncbi:MAG: hypothetical protein JJ908_12010 [Rhizobiales bacterium]|nr:hypothetical protein [Hyphomicrobiales bacterium]MBO6699549.1 hypothetical protein [Hyphomicrobiales bacterium]MBO6737087.1 hypothetical protein [Hyphomicrobiales bacterium]MBO6911839.1 hypothetical protein [Hyphomicrobiales bacterium]MBO6954776.1 hypothetical protein [Hyphomicrobiales bacterium]